MLIPTVGGLLSFFLRPVCCGVVSIVSRLLSSAVLSNVCIDIPSTGKSSNSSSSSSTWGFCCCWGWSEGSVLFWVWVELVIVMAVCVWVSRWFGLLSWEVSSRTENLRDKGAGVEVRRVRWLRRGSLGILESSSLREFGVGPRKVGDLVRAR